jgi:outer membrane protein assembly factor BamB
VTHADLSGKRTSLGLALLLCLAGPLCAGDWPCWRGPTAQGHCDEKDLPLEWDGKSGKNVLWKAELHGGRKLNPEFSSPGWSCPIVHGDRVFLTTAVWKSDLTEKERRKSIPAHHVLCYRAEDGKQLWDVEVPAGKCLVDNFYHGYTVPTPVTDGKRVFVLFGSGVVACLDFEGKVVWREELALNKKEIDGGICSSPILYDDSVIFPGIANPVLRAVYKKDGKLKWEQEGKEHNRMATPYVMEIDKKKQLIHLAGGARGYDPDTGKQLWFCRTAPTGLTSPVLGGGLIYTDSGRGGRSGAAVDPTGKGDVSKTHLKWQVDLTAPAGSSGIVVGKLLYRACGGDLLRCYKVADGELVYEKKLPRISPSTSPIATADGRIYFASCGRSYVIKAGEEYELLATNDLNEGDPYATPAISNGRIFIKGKSYLWCIGTK